MYQIALTFNPNEINMARPGLAGVWRVRHSRAVDDEQPIKVIPWYLTPKGGGDPVETKAMLMMSERPYARGAIVNPRRVLAECLHPLITFYSGRITA